MRSPDRVWAVEVWQQGSEQWYLLWRHGALIGERLGIATVERVLREAGVDVSELVED